MPRTRAPKQEAEPVAEPEAMGETGEENEGAMDATRVDADLAQVVNRIIPIVAIEPHPENYNEHPDDQVVRLRASDKRFGQVRSIVVQEGAPGQYLLVAGEGYWTSRRENGKHFIRADVIPADWTPVQIKGYLLADNLTAHGSFPNDALMLGLLQEQQRAGMDLLSVGSDEAAVQDLFAKVQPPTLDELAREYGDEPDTADFWPFVRVKVPPAVKRLFDSLMQAAPGTSEAVKFERMLRCVDTAALDQTGDLPSLDNEDNEDADDLIANAGDEDEDEAAERLWREAQPAATPVQPRARRGRGRG